MARIHWQEGRDLVTRTVLPGIAVWAVLVGIGLLITGPLSWIDHGEDRISEAFTRSRTDLLDPFSAVFSHVGNTEYVIGVCLVVVGLLWWRTRDLRWSVVPLVSISLQATIFLFATMAVGRQRPPAIPMDSSPPTSSYPSGHTGASTALYFSLLLMASTRIERDGLRRLAVGVCAVLPVLVALARLYRGAHHISDVVAGLLNGIVCALLAYHWWKATRKDKVAARARAAVS
ncbi:MAG: phosphatase PAP2 family protein [Pedococcus sp.]